MYMSYVLDFKQEQSEFLLYICFYWGSAKWTFFMVILT